MNGTYVKEKSWLKQSCYRLDNGFDIISEHGVYGPMLTTIEKDNVVIWHCSNGFKGLPRWAEQWIEPIASGHWERIVRPRLRKTY